MTAPDARQTDKLRELIAEAYAKWAEAPFEPAEWQRQNGHHLADALLPVVTAWARTRAAEELRKAACEALEKTPSWAPVMVPVADLFDRAAALADDRTDAR